MVSPQQRRVTQRAARPRRVRQRRRVITPQRDRIDWATLGSTVAALAAAAGLVFTAWSTYTQARVADDQLKKSAQDDLKESRGQASKISFWNDPRTKKAIIVNRSLDPIDLITWSGKTLKDNGSARQPTGKGSVKKAASAVVITPNSFSVPPCSRV